MFRVRAVPSLAIFLAGSMDCLTTVIGIVFFGAVECNPFLSNLASISLAALVAVKLVTTIFVGVLFHKADKALVQNGDKSHKNYKFIRYALKGSYITATIILFAAVVNNIIVVARIA